MNIKLCTETFNDKNPASIESYIKHGGYSAWKDIVNSKSSKSSIIDKVKNWII